MESKMIHRKETLVITAVAIIHEKGFQGLSTRELANREGVSEATIFKHFKTKNELMFAVLDHYSQFDEALAEAAYSKGATLKERLLLLMKSILRYYENYPEITAVLEAYGALINEKDLKEKFILILSKRAEAIKRLIDEAIDLGEMDPSIDSQILTDIIIGTLDRIILKWRVEKCEFSLTEYTLAAINFILDTTAPIGNG